MTLAVIDLSSPAPTIDTLSFVVLMLVGLSVASVSLAYSMRLNRFNNAKQSFASRLWLAFGAVLLVVTMVIGITWGMQHGEAVSQTQTETVTVALDIELAASTATNGVDIDAIVAELPSAVVVPPTFVVVDLVVDQPTPTPTLPSSPVIASTNTIELPIELPDVLPPPIATDQPFPPPAPTAKPFLPGQLSIPKLGIFKNVVQAPMKNGAWELRYLGQEIGWLPTTGVQPGDTLAMAFAAHVTDYDGTRGPFYYLRSLQPGDGLTYKWGGFEFQYQVTRQDIVAPDDVEKLYVADGETLILVTCANWNSRVYAYTERVVTFAQLISSQPLQ